MPNKSEAQWEAESDARTLARAREINQDTTRLSKAKTAAGPLAKEEAEEAKHLQDVSRNLKDVEKTGAGRPAVEQSNLPDTNIPQSNVAQSPPAPAASGENYGKSALGNMLKRK